MNASEVKILRRLLRESVKICSSQDEGLAEEINDVCDDLEVITEDFYGLESSLTKLESALNSGEMKNIIEAVSSLRVFCGNMESKYSNLASVVTDVLSSAANALRLKAAKEHETLGLKELLEKNDRVEIGTFTDELHYQQSFNKLKLNHLLSLLIKQNENDPEIASMAFRIYSRILKMISYHFNMNDGFSIKDMDSEGIAGIYELVDKFESVLLSLFKDDREHL